MSRPTRLFQKTPFKKRGLKTNKHATADYLRARDKFLFGSLGAASPVRKIDPSTGNIVAVIDPETGLPMRPGIRWP